MFLKANKRLTPGRGYAEGVRSVREGSVSCREEVVQSAAVRDIFKEKPAASERGGAFSEEERMRRGGVFLEGEGFSGRFFD